jgi:hypothetical protein
MSPELLQRLQLLDRLGCESPPDLDYRQAVTEIAALRPSIEHLLGYNLTAEGCIQDAAHLDGFWLRGPEHQGTSFGVRFSAFGRMVTIFRDGTNVFADRLPAIIDLLQQNGFIYVSEEDLSEPYTGGNPDLARTWFDRFFDYL